MGLYCPSVPSGEKKPPEANEEASGSQKYKVIAGVVVAVILIIAIVLGLLFGLPRAEEVDEESEVTLFAKKKYYSFLITRFL
jgi:hypothetical protein